MKDFPCSEEEWAEVKAVALDIVNATMADDHVLRASRFEDLRALVHSLEASHGKHPLLTETLADFEEDVAESIGLYRQAREQACAANLPIHTIQLSLARLLLEEMQDRSAAHEALIRCKQDVFLFGDEEEQKEYRQLIKTCRCNSDLQ